MCECVSPYTVCCRVHQRGDSMFVLYHWQIYNYVGDELNSQLVNIVLFCVLSQDGNVFCVGFC